MKLFKLFFILASMMGLSHCGTSREDEKAKTISYFEIGQGLLAEGRTPEAIEYLQMAYERDSSNPQYAMILGVALSQVRQYPQSIRFLNEALKLRSPNPDAWNNLAAVYLKMNDPQKALSAADEALKIPTYKTPDFAWAHKAQAYLKLGKLTQAFQAADAGLRLSPMNCRLRLFRSRLWNTRKAFDQSYLEARQSLEICPEDPLGHMVLAYNLFYLNKKEDAVAKYEHISRAFRGSLTAQEAEQALLDLKKGLKPKNPWVGEE